MTKKIKPIKTEADYNRTLARIEALMGAEPGSNDADELEVLVALVEKHEAVHYPILPPSPVEAIKYRMEQLDLKPRDLVPFIGSKSKVSEVLAGKRSLSLGMVRALHKALNIPAEILIQESGAELPPEPENIVWQRYPLKQMAKRGWIDAAKDFKVYAEEYVRGLFARAGDMLCVPEACFRGSTRKNAKADPYALQAWLLGVKATARQNPLKVKYDPARLNEAFLHSVARLSVLPEGPRVARDYLATCGIHLVVERHFNRTYLDGAAMLLEDGTPVVGLTLRYDRIDYFWFSLLHELAHVMKHLSPGNTTEVVDDLEIAPSREVEKEADRIAQEAEIPEKVWREHPASRTGKVEDVLDLAGKVGIHPAIVAGRVRREKQDYRLLSKHVGHGEVRALFQEVPA